MRPLTPEDRLILGLIITILIATAVAALLFWWLADWPL
jgi:hypothetical protein